MAKMIPGHMLTVGQGCKGPQNAKFVFVSSGRADAGGSGGLSGGAIFGIVLAALLVVGLACTGGYLLYHRRSRTGRGWQREGFEGSSSFLQGNPADVEISQLRRM